MASELLPYVSLGVVLATGLMGYAKLSERVKNKSDQHDKESTDSKEQAKIERARLEAAIAKVEAKADLASHSASHAAGADASINMRIGKLEGAVETMREEASTANEGLRTWLREEFRGVRDFMSEVSRNTSEKVVKLQEKVHELDKSKASVSDMKAVRADARVER